MRKTLLLLAIFSFTGCDALVGPSHSDYENPNYTDLRSWYPCVVVQTPGFRGSPEFEGQMSAVRKLHNAGRMDWIRLGDIDLQGGGRDYAIGAKNMGLHVFGIMDLADLEIRPSWEASFDELYSMYPEVDIWEIGGEISNPAINPRVSTAEFYMDNFKRLNAYVKQRYPRAVLTSAPTLGSGGGPAEFKRFIELGLLDMDVIIAVNVYDFSLTGHTLQNYASIFSRYREQLSKKRIWITETGSHIRDRQVEYVENFYPQLITALHPEMVCWYVMWSDDNGSHLGHALLNNLLTGPPDNSNLFKKLTGEVEW